MKRKIFLISLLILMPVFSCKSPHSSDLPNPEPEYRDEPVEVIYNRDPAKIRFPEANDNAVILNYELFDPDKNPDPNRFPDDWYENSFRNGARQMEKIVANKYRVFIEHVFIQNSSYQPKHTAYIRDYKLWLPPHDDTTRTSMYTGEGLRIQGTYEEEIVQYQQGTKRRFKMSKE